MLAKRIVYAIITVASVVVFIVTESGVALYLSVLLLSLPAFSLLLLYIASKRVKFDCAVRDTCMRGGVLGLTMRLGIKPRLIVGCGEVVMRIENTTFSKTEEQTFVFYDLSFTGSRYEYLSRDTGRIRLTVTKIRLLDLLGICSFTLKRNLNYEAIVSPVLYENLNVMLGASSHYGSMGEKVDVARRGGDRSETFNIRDYVAGDSLNAVHWKLSSKFDSLKSREYGSTSDYKILLFVDLSRIKNGKAASDEQLNCVLDITVSLSDSFRGGGIPHCVGWMDEGAFRFSEVWDDESFLKMTYALMSAKVTEEDARAIFYLKHTQEALGFTKFIFISSGAHFEELQELDEEITAISVGQNLGELTADKIRLIEFSPQNITTALSAVTL